jgi:hypothetical protein
MEETFATQSMLRCYNHGKVATAIREMLGFSHGEVLLLEVGN